MKNFNDLLSRQDDSLKFIIIVWPIAITVGVLGWIFGWGF